MPGRREPLPKKGDKKLSADFLKEIALRGDQLGRVAISGGELSIGPAGMGIMIPEVPEPELLKIVHHDYLPAAHGGYAGAGHWNHGPEARALGNYVEENSQGTGTAERRRMFARTCPQWEFKDAPSGYGLADDGSGNCYLSRPSSTGLSAPNLQVMSPYDLPLQKGMALAYPINPTEPDKLQYMVVCPLTVNPWGPVKITWFPNSSAEANVYIDNDPSGAGGVNGYGKFLRNLQGFESFDLSDPARNWLHIYHGDLILTYPGQYKITFGLSASCPTQNYKNVSTGVNSSGAGTHVHSYTVTHTPVIGLEPFINWGGGNVWNVSRESAASKNLLLLNVLAQTADPSNFQNGSSTAEKTVIIRNDRTATHGGDYTRISFAAGMQIQDLPAGYTNTNFYCSIHDFWAIVEPCPVGPGYFGGGANVYPTGYNQNNIGGLFKWWGAGPIPPRFDYLGNVF